jgi:hypothetical protein
MARIAYGFHPRLNGFFPYGGFPDNPNRKGRIGHVGSQKKKKVIVVSVKRRQG